MSPASPHIENVLLLVLIQLIVIIGSARVFGLLFRRMGQPLVCGEIAAGLILGPSALGGLFPGLFQQVFTAEVAPTFAILSQIGVILLMFLIGLEFDFGHLNENRGTAASVSIVGIVLPFTLGFVLGHWMHGELGLTGSRLNFALFLAAAMSVTAIPVLGRIMIELNLTRTRIGSVAMASAAVGDATGWIILAAVTAIVRSTLDAGKLGWMVVETMAFAVVMVWVVRPLMIRAIRRVMVSGRGLTLDTLALLLVVIMLSAIATNLIGIFAVFGSFLLGAVLHDQAEFRHAVQERLRDFITVFFLPIFFTYTGLKTDAGSMSGGMLWLMCGLVLVTAVVGKFAGCSLAARGNGVPWRESAIIGVLMNTRGLMELIVVNMGYDLGIIPKSVYFILVMMAVVTTFMTTPLLRRLIRSSELEAHYLESPFADFESRSAR